MSHKYSHLIWLGANTAAEPANLLSCAQQVTLFEAREAASLALQKKYPEPHISVINALVTATNQTVNFTEYNLADFSATQPATGLIKFFPGLKALKSEPQNGIAIGDAFNKLALGDDNNLLVVDIPDSSLALLKALEASKQLSQFSAIYVHTAYEPLYADAASQEDIIFFMQSQGYLPQETASSDPDLPWLSFNLNPLWKTLQQVQQKNRTLDAELKKIKTELEAVQLEAINSKQSSDQKNIESNKQLQSLEQQVADQKQQLATTSKQKQETEQQLATAKQQLSTVQQELVAAKQAAEQSKSEQKQLLDSATKAKQDAEQQLATVKQQLSSTQQELTNAQQQKSENDLSQALEQKIQKMFADQAQQLTKEVGNIKNHINSGLGNTAKQLEAFMGIQNYLERGVKPLSFHGWPISPDIGLYIAGLIDENNYDVIIEFGSGTSTVLMAKALISKLRGTQTKTLANTSQSSDIAVQDNSFSDLPARIVTFEHNSLYHSKTQKALEDSGVAHLVDLVHAPLVDYQYKDGSQYLYYNCNEKLQELAKIFKDRKANILVLVDGPPGSTNKNARFPALPHLINNLPEHSFTIIMDDYNRAEEKEIVGIWSKICESRFMSHTTEEIPSEKGLSVIKIG